MKNLKPSELPEGTVIDDERQGEYIKRAEGVWEEMDRDYMGDRQRVTDAGYSDSEDYGAFLRRTERADMQKSDDYFTDYKVIASDPEFDFGGVMLHGQWDSESGTHVDGTANHYCKGYNCEA
jgi:hypothetical protein